MTIPIDRAAAIEQLRHARRIVVVGCAGSGKSTLSMRLSESLDLPYLSMDREIFWLPGWQLRPRAEALERMKAFVQRDRWIFDGNSPGSMSIRLDRADMVIWMRPPRHVSVYGILSRWLRHRGTIRPGMPEGCPEKMDWPFFRYVWTFEREEVPQFEHAFAKARADLPILTLRSFSEGRQLAEGLENGQLEVDSC